MATSLRLITPVNTRIRPIQKATAGKGMHSVKKHRTTKIPMAMATLIFQAPLSAFALSLSVRFSYLSPFFRSSSALSINALKSASLTLWIYSRAFSRLAFWTGILYFLHHWASRAMNLFLFIAPMRMFCSMIWAVSNCHWAASSLLTEKRAAVIEETTFWGAMVYSMPTSFTPYGVGMKSTAKNRTTGMINIFQSMYLSYPVTFFLFCFIQFYSCFQISLFPV